MDKVSDIQRSCAALKQAVFKRNFIDSSLRTRRQIFNESFTKYLIKAKAFDSIMEDEWLSTQFDNLKEVHQFILDYLPGKNKCDRYTSNIIKCIFKQVLKPFIETNPKVLEVKVVEKPAELPEVVKTKKITNKKANWRLQFPNWKELSPGVKKQLTAIYEDVVRSNNELGLRDIQYRNGKFNVRTIIFEQFSVGVYKTKEEAKAARDAKDAIFVKMVKLGILK